MQLPEVTPLDGRSIATVIGYLTDVRDRLSNMGSGNASDMLSAYQQWVSSSTETLGYAFDHDALETLVLTRRAWHLMATHRMLGEHGNGPAIVKAFQAEQTDRLRVLDALIAKYRSCETRWSLSGAKFVVPDTNFFLHHDVAFDEANWAALAQPIIGQGVRVIVPIAVVRELDRQKRSGKHVKVGNDRVELRTRARTTLRSLRQMFEDPDACHELSSAVSVELLLDPLSHRPAPSVDTEIIERVLAAKRLTGRDVHLLTGDLSMRLMAGIEGLSVLDGG